MSKSYLNNYIADSKLPLNIFRSLKFNPLKPPYKFNMSLVHLLLIHIPYPSPTSVQIDPDEHVDMQHSPKAHLSAPR